MTARTAQPPADWTPDAELARYATAQHDRPLHAYHDLGDLHATFTDVLKQAHFDLSFLNDRFTDVRAWRTQVLPELHRAMALPTHPRPVHARILQRIQNPDHDREEIEFTSAFGQRIPATVLVPRSSRPPFPAVVALHDMGGFRAFGREKLLSFPAEPAYLTDFRQRCYAGQSIAHALVARGFLVICIDSMMFGQRTPAAQRDPDAFLRNRLAWQKSDADDFANTTSLHNEKFAAITASMVGLNWAGMIASDDLATVDYLTTRPDVDPRHIGCVGLSYGAYRANYLAALDQRIHAAVSVCWMATLDSVIGPTFGGSLGAFMLLPSLHAHLDIPDLAALTCPRPFLAISGWRDTLMQPRGITAAHRKLRAIWQKANAPAHLASLCYDSPHEFNTEMQSSAFTWLQRWLQPDQ